MLGAFAGWGLERENSLQQLCIVTQCFYSHISVRIYHKPAVVFTLIPLLQVETLTECSSQPTIVKGASQLKDSTCNCFYNSGYLHSPIYCLLSYSQIGTLLVENMEEKSRRCRFGFTQPTLPMSPCRCTPALECGPHGA